MDVSKIDLSKIPEYIENIGNKCVKGMVKVSEHACSSIQEHIKNIKTLNDKVSSKARVLKGTIRAKIDTIKNFFDKSPTIGKVCKDLGITHKDFCNYPEPLQKAIVDYAVSSYNDDGDSLNKLFLAKELAGELKLYKEENPDQAKEIQKFLSKIEGNVKELTAEVEKEQNFLEALGGVSRPTEAQEALAISKTFGGKTISTETELTFSIATHAIEVKKDVFEDVYETKTVNVKTENIPQKLLAGFGKDKDLLQVSSEFQGETDHATNLWKQKISVGDKSIAFIRCGNTRGEESAGKEILANALSLNFTEDQIQGADSPDKAIKLSFSNIQLMTPGTLGKITDKDMPFKQMDMFKALASADKQPLELNYKGKKVYVNLQPPLLFNFGTNGQWFSKVFDPVVNFKETIARNDESFRQLFGDLKIFGGKLGTSSTGSREYIFNGKPGISREEPHYMFDQDTLVGKAISDIKIDQSLKRRIRSLSDQILDICLKSKQGVPQNPYALASRVTLLTNLLGYATSYGCKSGKDRTGVMAMEMENLTAKVLTDTKPYDPYTESAEEKKNLQAIYKEGTAVEIAKINRGGKQNKLKIQKMGFLFTSLDHRFGVDLAKNFEKNVKKLK